MRYMLHHAAFAVFNAVAITVASAQGPAVAPRPDPSDAKAAVPPTLYASPFGKYRPMGEEGVERWKETNDTVGRIGGWQAYLKEGRQPEAPAKPGEAGHAGHKTK